MKTTIELANGKTVEASLGMLAIKSLRSKDKSLYNTANEMICHGTENVEDISKAIYAGYVATSTDENVFSEDEFISLLPDSYAEQVRILKSLL